MYSGRKCEVASAELQRIQQLSTASVVIAIVCIVSFYLIIICNDLINRCIRSNTPVARKKGPNIQKYYYKP